MRDDESLAYEAVVRVCGQLARSDFAGAPKANSEVDQVTLDTNLLHDLWKDRPRRWAIEDLVELAHEGSIALAVTAYVNDDVPYSPLRDRISELPQLNIRVTGGLFTVSESALDGADFFGSEAFSQC
jgi:hypothetical protein